MSNDQPCRICGTFGHSSGGSIWLCPIARPVGATTRPPREAYVRVSRPCAGSGDFVEPGVEFRDGDSFSEMSFELYDLCFRNDISGRDDDPLVMAKTVEKAIISRWPDRAYFVEVHSGQGWIQIFQPFGVPRNP